MLVALCACFRPLQSCSRSFARSVCPAAGGCHGCPACSPAWDTRRTGLRSSVSQPDLWPTPGVWLSRNSSTLLWPVLLLVAVRWARWLAVAGIGLAVLARVPMTGSIGYWSTFTRMDALLVGCLLWLNPGRLPRIWAPVGLALIVLAGLLMGAVTDQIAMPLAILGAALVVRAPWPPDSAGDARQARILDLPVELATDDPAWPWRSCDGPRPVVCRSLVPPR